MKDRFRSSHKYFLLVVVLCETFNAASVTAQPYIVASGRTYPGPKSTYGMLDLPQVLSWSATQLTTKFYGSDVTFSLSRASNEAESLSGPFRSLYLPLEIIVVGRVNITRTCLVGLPALPCTVQGLPLGNYSVAIRKVSEALSGEAVLRSIDVISGRFLPVELPPELRTGRRILFIGDSITAGLGNLGNATCTLPAAVGSLENSFLSYAGLTASQLQADFQIIAWSAAGVKMQTFLNASDNLLAVPVVEDDSGPSGGFPEPPANVFPTDPHLFRRAVAGDLASTYNFSSWVPQVIVFAGGVNDFAAGAPNETWWVNGYATFIQNVTAIYSDAKVVLVALPYVAQLSGLPGSHNAGQGAAGESSGAYQSYMARLFTELQTRGVPAHFIALSTDGLDPSNWCQSHPNLEAHEMMGAQLLEFMRATLPEFVTGTFPTTISFAST